MRVLIIQKTGYANPARSIDLACGDTADLRADLAAKLIRVGIAKVAPAVTKTATVTPTKTVVKHAAKSKPAPKTKEVK